MADRRRRVLAERVDDERVQRVVDRRGRQFEQAVVVLPVVVERFVAVVVADEPSEFLVAVVVFWVVE